MKTTIKTLIAAATLVAAASPSFAEEWSDTFLTYHTGSQFAEPYEGNNITKNILSLTHVGGYKYGTNFFNIDMLMSDKNDPASPGANSGAQEAYVVYRHFLDFSKVSGTSLKYGPIRTAGLLAGFDWNTKSDAGYNSKKRMLAIGPQIDFDVPGFLNVSVVELFESNAPYNAYTGTGVDRYNYTPHPQLGLVWGIPLWETGLSFEGYANFIAAKGTDEFGNQTAAETNIDMQLMYDIGKLLGAAPKTMKIGVEYQWWKNKFGNDANGPAGSGAFAQTPMLRAEYHF